ncbi:MAG: DUF4249 family protein [Bacteroidales bacterium]|nr:DUF4249 family protein [Deltaproteobacteria bacterium]MBL7138167.1 DUF4249 family protein [Bacteroidales bacterium]
MRILARHILFLILLTGCVKEADLPIPDQPASWIVVDATLTDEQKVHAVSITMPVTGLNEIPKPITGATVLITTADSLWILTEDPLQPGDYLTDSLFVAQVGHTYTLQISHAGNNFSAKAEMVPGKVFNELTYKKNEGDDWYHIDWVASAFSVDNPAMWEILIDWSTLPGFITLDPAACRARLLFFTLPTIDVSQIFAPVMEQTSFPAGSIINERRYSLTPGHAEFLRQLLLETNWQGSMFPTANANVITNLSPGALGYFGVCAVTELSLVVE